MILTPTRTMGSSRKEEVPVAKRLAQQRDCMGGGSYLYLYFMRAMHSRLGSIVRLCYWGVGLAKCDCSGFVHTSIRFESVLRRNSVGSL